MSFDPDWLAEAQRRGASHLVVVCDTFDHDDYPVYVMPGTNVREVVQRYSLSAGNMQRVMEVYNMAIPLEPQIKEYRAYNL